MLFQSDRPLIHKIYYKQVEIVRTFFSYFVKPDVLVNCKTGPQLIGLELKPEHLLPKELMFVGVAASKLIDKLGKTHEDVVKFLNDTVSAYLSCGRYIQKKLPLENYVLKTFTSIDPLFITSPNKLVLERLESLPKILTNILGDEEETLYQEQVRALLLDGQLPAALDEGGEEVDCVRWWVSISTKYPVVFKMVIAVLSNFHGPRVESSFNVMGDVLDKKSGRMNMSTYSAIQTVKYGLKARQPSAKHMSVGNFSRGDKHYSPVNEKLAKNMRGAFNSYKQELVKKKEEKEAWEKLYEVEKESITRKKLKDDNSAATETAYLEHQKILELAYKTKRKLPRHDAIDETKKKKQCQDEARTQDKEERNCDDEASALVVEDVDDNDTVDANEVLVQNVPENPGKSLKRKSKATNEKKIVAPKKKKQSDMFSFLIDKNQNQGEDSNKESERDVEGADFEWSKKSCNENESLLREANAVVQSKKKGENKGESCKKKGNGEGKKKQRKEDPKQKKKTTKSSLSRRFRKSHVENSVDSNEEVLVPRWTYQFSDSSDEEESNC